jgi:hypothetical protein
MNFDTNFERFEKQLCALREAISADLVRLKKAEETTNLFLKACADAGITELAIGTRHDSIPASKSWPFCPGGSVFTTEARGANGWPAIWKVVSDFGISTGCGNSNQHSANTACLIDGVYHFRAGAWRKIEEENE